jgi:hypothetical protein
VVCRSCPFPREGAGGTDLTRINTRVKPDEFLDVLPGWSNDWFPFKTLTDFGIDVRNYDPTRL